MLNYFFLAKNYLYAIYIILFAVLPLVLVSCGNGVKDSTAIADSANLSRDSGNNEHPVTWGQEVSAEDAKFAVKAAAGGMTEVELGKLAQQRGSNSAVKKFGAMMVKDHSAANAKLMELAKSKHIVLPAKPDNKLIKLKADLVNKTGKDFDKAYIDAMVEDHEQDTTDFVRALKVIRYPEMRSFAQKTLPVLKMHLAAAQKLKNNY